MGSSSLGDSILYLIPVSSAARKVPGLRENRNRQSMDQNYSDDKIILLSLTVPPKAGDMKFNFGADYDRCDVSLPGRNISGRQFIIGLCPSSGIPVLINKSPSGTKVGTKTLSVNETLVLEQNVAISCGDYRFMVVAPSRGSYQKKYEERLRKFLGRFQEPGDNPCVYANPIQIRRRVGQFLELQKLGSGGFGDVLLFAHSENGEVYAAKRFQDKRNYSAMTKEIKTLQNLSHENIVEFSGWVEDDEGCLCLLMEYLPHGDLLGYGKLEIPVVLTVLSQCLDGLAYLRKHHIMHRDIKPNNIAVQSINPVRVKLIDFGLAREGSVAATFCGTVCFIAPEILRGESYSHLVDIWALGLSALQLLTGLPERELEKFHRSKNPEHFMEYFKAIHRKRETLPEPLSRFLKGMLEYDQRDRWSAKECLSRLKTVEEAFPGRQDPRNQRRNPPPRYYY